MTSQDPPPKSPALPDNSSLDFFETTLNHVSDGILIIQGGSHDAYEPNHKGDIIKGTDLFSSL